MYLLLWKHTDSNRGPSACKADALNQLSYASIHFKRLAFFLNGRQRYRLFFILQNKFVFYSKIFFSLS